MTYEDARQSLLLHSFAGNDVDDPRMSAGFLGSLRPYRGLVEENFFEVMEALKAVAPNLQSGDGLDRDVVSSLWDICLFARCWGVQADGMLRGNNIISEEDVSRLEKWIDTITWTTSCLLSRTSWLDALETGNIHHLDLSQLK